MSYDLKPRNKELEEFTFGAFSWGWLLDSGVGLVIGCCPGLKAGQYYFSPDKKGNDPRCNDGYYVNKAQATEMGYLTKNLVQNERHVAKDWETLCESEQEYYKSMGRFPIMEDFLERAEKFSDWAIKSKGFWIY